MSQYYTLNTPEQRKFFNEEVMRRQVNGVHVTVMFDEPASTPTALQKRAMWLWAEQCGDFLNDCGLDQRVVLDPAAPIPWTKHAFVDQIWRKVSKAMFGEESTKKVGKLDYAAIEQVICRHISESQQVTLPEWPRREI